MLDGNENHEILTHITPARTNALGQRGGTQGEVAIPGHSDQINLRNYDNSNQGHSGEFYSSLSERKLFWEQGLSKGTFPDSRQRPVSCLAGWVSSLPGEKQCGQP